MRNKISQIMNSTSFLFWIKIINLNKGIKRTAKFCFKDKFLTVSINSIFVKETFQFFNETIERVMTYK
ncbi:hypothetical protein BpHYR1_001279 [Brachionus plicatilis]|uniref:Uncharacterized protein n=1 Tax=Brachionus plicatilis TaxID=10195 RepID=A0A3M7P6E9_BRAPC|nr:hypothetical protein BpHYR1_001279 [Brachionus plicatilis]